MGGCFCDCAAWHLWARGCGVGAKYSVAILTVLQIEVRDEGLKAVYGVLLFEKFTNVSCSVAGFGEYPTAVWGVVAVEEVVFR